MASRVDGGVSPLLSNTAYSAIGKDEAVRLFGSFFLGEGNGAILKMREQWIVCHL
jgi:hypothetical protein